MKRRVLAIADISSRLIPREQVLDAILKEICAALLESDVNVKLVASLRQKVKAKVKASFETGGADKVKESNRKSLMQKVRTLRRVPDSRMMLMLQSPRPYLMN